MEVPDISTTVQQILLAKADTDVDIWEFRKSDDDVLVDGLRFLKHNK